MDTHLYNLLLAEIRKSFPKKSVMVDTLAEILRIEKGAVYRRLRQEVPFIFNEIAQISKHLNISLDNLIGIATQNIVPFKSLLPNFSFPQEIDYDKIELNIDFFKSISQSENSETASALNQLPHEFFNEYQHLFKFYLFKWNFFNNNDKTIPYNQISISKEMCQLLKKYSLEKKKFKKANFIFDSRIFKIIVNEIDFFYSIRLIEKEDVLNIKGELFSLLDDIEKLALTGKFKETGNSVNLYISEIDVPTNYTYMESENFHLSIVKMFLLTSVSSTDENAFEKMKMWINALIKISTLITLTNERQRVMYFEKQRKIVNEL